MESQKAKIALYAKRSFGEKMNASFDFIKENWKPLFKFTTYLILPLCLIQALSMNGLMSGSMAAAMNTQAGAMNPFEGFGLAFWMNYGLTVICYMIGSVILTSLVYSLIKTYNDREERLEGITLSALKSLLLKDIGKLFILTLFCILLVLVVCVIVGLLVALTPFTLILTFPLLIACAVPMALLSPIYLFENISLWGAFRKTFRLGFATWGGVFLIALIMGLISSILQGITMLPWYIATIVKYFFAMSDSTNAVTVSPVYNFFLYLLGIIQTFGVYVSSIFTIIGLTYQYGHASEVVDSVSVEEDIDNFDKL
ncbi:hypothetical protein [Bacteroides sp.]